MQPLIRIHPQDNVAVALRDLARGELVFLYGQSLRVIEPVSRGHKIALTDISALSQVIKYGFPIGHATQSIASGALVDESRMRTNLSELHDYQYQPQFESVTTNLPDRDVEIYRRANGQVGIRNELWLLPTVGCVNAMARQMIKQLQRDNELPGVDGVYLFSHPYGCSQLGDDLDNTRSFLQNLVHHPNAGAVLVVGLGCENNQLASLRQTLGDYDEQRVKFMACQQHDDEVEHGVELLQQLAGAMAADLRSPGKLSELAFGLECGGSDGFSGITANPLLGAFSDYITAHGGTSVLTEVPEMFGAEHLLMARCKDIATFDKTVSMINGFKQYFIDHQQPIYENPSPGNKAGGISTLEEKSLGCTQKAGTGKVMDVLAYGERLQQRGLNLLSAPGNDAVATSALAIAGCQMILFTTGRGTPYGGPVPTLKIATNSEIARRKKHWIDFNAGQLIEGTKMAQLLNDFIDQIVAVANGQPSCNEVNDFREIAIFKTGVTV